MSLKNAIALIAQNVGAYLTRKFTGKIVITFDCRNGGIGNLSMSIDQRLVITEDLKEIGARPGKD